jgi:hypothetical protein
MSQSAEDLPLRVMGTFLARYVMTRLVDDIDGSQAVTTLSFSVDGRSYEIDLSESHLSAFQQALAPFVTAARTVPGGRRPAREPAPAAPPNGRAVPARDAAPAETATATATPRPAAVDVAPFRQAAPARGGAARPAREKPERAPLVADPFTPRS